MFAETQAPNSPTNNLSMDSSVSFSVKARFDCVTLGEQPGYRAKHVGHSGSGILESGLRYHDV